jgi:hypothetical protein
MQTAQPGKLERGIWALEFLNERYLVLLETAGYKTVGSVVKDRPDEVLAKLRQHHPVGEGAISQIRIALLQFDVEWGKDDRP